MHQSIRVQGAAPHVPTCLKPSGRLPGLTLLFTLLVFLAASPLWAKTFVTYDFTTGLAGWTTNQYMANLQTTSEGLAFDSLGTDPYCWGPQENFPADLPLMVTIRMKSQADASGEMFYGAEFQAGQSVTLAITPDGQFHDYTLNLPAQPAGSRLRLDPAGSTPGHIVVAFIKVDYFPRSEVVASWDFRQGWQGWAPNSDTTHTQITADGADFDTLSNDPWLEGPAADYPNDQGVMVTIHMRSTADTAGALYYGQNFSETRVMGFTVINDGQWHDYQLILPPLGLGARLRLDPAMAAGHVTVQLIQVKTLVPVNPPPVATPVRPTGAAAQTLVSGPLTLVHYGQRWGGFVVQVNGLEFASSHDDGRVAVLVGETIHWINLKTGSFTLNAQAGQLVEQVQVTDDQGGTITLRRTIRPGVQTGALDVTVDVTSTRAEYFYHIPWLTLLPGLGTFGTQKQQGLFAGLEYLHSSDTSSSTDDADASVPGHVRRVPAPYKITMPLMALAWQGQYFGLIWNQTDLTAAVFDTPDRVFNSGAQLMALWAPTVGQTHLENELYPEDPFPLNAGKMLSVSATMIGGAGQSIVPAIQQYVALRGLPALPSPPGGTQGTFSLLAGGWLDSGVYDKNGHWQHAVWGDPARFQLAADPPVFMRWLAWRTTDTALAGRLRAEAAKGQDKLMAEGDPSASTRVGHVSHSDPALMFGSLPGYLGNKQNDANGRFGLFDLVSGVRTYVPGTVDYGKTHFANHANGQAATDLYAILEAASLTGDQTTITKAIGLLNTQTALYANSEPRGAQTWEVPLHTPDILASAYLVRAYLMGYKMTGRQTFLDQAVYWAWTGVPFVYLTPPASGPVGVYSTIAVYGATGWIAPLWIGLPVQWCGLVYGAALHELSLYDQSGPWAQLAQGITITGLQMNHPASDPVRQGLLPDSYNLVAQIRNPVPINPGTVSATLPQVFGLGRMYEFRVLPHSGWFVNAPCAINAWNENSAGANLSLDGFGPERYRVLVSRVAQKPYRVMVRSSGAAGEWTSASTSYDSSHRWLIINNLTGPVDVLIQATNAASEGWLEWMR